LALAQAAVCLLTTLSLQVVAGAVLLAPLVAVAVVRVASYLVQQQ